MSRLYESLEPISPSDDEDKEKDKFSSIIVSKVESTTSTKNWVSNTAYIQNSSAFLEHEQEFSEYFERHPHDPIYFSTQSTTPNKCSLVISGTSPTEHDIKEAGDGPNGKRGASAPTNDDFPSPGAPGSDGGHGMDGQDGFDGDDAHDAPDGLNSHNIYLKVSGTRESLIISGSCEGTFKLDKISLKDSEIRESMAISGSSDTTLLLDENEVIFVNAAGTNGIDGLRGGAGGRGGDGGNASNGSLGGDSEGSLLNGCRGGHGGNSGSGGDGGRGGRGGKPGNGGNGGNILLHVEDPKLLMLFSFDVRGGRSGKVGIGGPGGDPGKAGTPGHGARGGKPKPNSTGKPGASGHEGRKGIDGKRGLNGSNSVPGKNGQDGKVLFKVNSQEVSHKLYQLIVSDFSIVGENNDGVLEPGEKVILSDFAFLNSGGLTSPVGIVLKVKSNKFTPMDHDGIILQAIKPNEKTINTNQVIGFLSDVESPITIGHFIDQVQLAVEMQVFEKSMGNFFSKTITVQYPIKIEKLVSSPVLSPGDSCNLKIEFTNLSNRDYGYESSVPIDYKIILMDSNLSFANHAHQKTLLGQISKISSKNTAFVQEAILIDSNAKLYSKTKYMVELYYKSKLIQISEQTIRIAPKFNPKVEETDLLFISNPDLTWKEYTCYEWILSHLNLTANFFDVEMYKAEALWKDLYRCKPIVIVQATQTALPVKMMDLISHFTSKDAFDHDSGLVIIGPSDLSFHLFDVPKTTSAASKDEMTEMFVVNNPTREDMQKKCQAIADAKMTEFPSFLYNVEIKEFCPEKVWYSYYYYGEAVIKLSSLCRTHKILNVLSTKDVNSSQELLSPEFKQVKEAKVYISQTRTLFFEVMMAIVGSLSLEAKINLLKGNNKMMQNRCKFLDQNTKREFDFAEVLRSAIYHDVKDEYFMSDQGISRVEKLVEIFKKDKSLHTREHISNFWIILKRLEGNTFWKSLPYISGFSEKRGQLSKICGEFENYINDVGSEFGIESIKRDAEAQTKDPSRIKFKEMFTMTTYPLKSFK